MGAGGAAVVKVDGVSAVQVLAAGRAVRILVPKRADIVRRVEPEWVRVLT